MKSRAQMKSTPKNEKNATLNPVRITLRDVAKKIGVSHSTISLCLRNHHSIPIKRRLEVKRVAEEMGYRPDPLLSSLVAYRNRKRPVTIQSAIAWINHWDQPEQLRKFREFDLYWRGASAAAERFGYHLDEVRWTSDYSAKRFEKILLTRNIRGLLIPPHASPPDWGDFNWNKFSVIRFGMSVPNPDTHIVTGDQQRAILMAMKKIHSYGYERIGLVVGGDYDHRLGCNFIGGFRAAQEWLKLRHVLPPLTTEQQVYRDHPDKAQSELGKWLKRHQPDALLTVVVEVPAMLRVLGYRIPEDIAVAGTTIYDIPVDTGINQNPEAVGKIAVEMLVAQINLNECGEPSAPCRILVESLWKDGKSMPPRKEAITCSLEKGKLWS